MEDFVTKLTPISSLEFGLKDKISQLQVLRKTSVYPYLWTSKFSLICNLAQNCKLQLILLIKEIFPIALTGCSRK